MMKTYSMPPFFGGNEFNPDYEVRINDVVCLNFNQTTEGNQLANYLPEGFELLRPELSISYCQYREVELLFGGSYNLVSIAVPARFNGRSDQLEGTFSLVVWENDTRPIIGGREIDGQPKIYADIQDLHIFQEKYFTNLSYDGNTFLHLEMVEPQPMDCHKVHQINAAVANQNVLGWRYIPKVGAPGADLSQPILYPQSMKVKSAWIGKGDVQWTTLSKKYQYVDVINRYVDLPSQYEIIKGLAKLPIAATLPVTMLKGSAILRPYMSRVLK